MTRYAHAKPGERCTKCNDYATRVVAAQPLCIVHFDNIVGALTRTVRRRMLTPTDISAEGFKSWSVVLQHGIDIGVLTTDEVRDAWEAAREFAA